MRAPRSRPSHFWLTPIFLHVILLPRQGAISTKIDLAQKTAAGIEPHTRKSKKKYVTNERLTTVSNVETPSAAPKTAYKTKVNLPVQRRRLSLAPTTAHSSRTRSGDIVGSNEKAKSIDTSSTRSAVKRFMRSRLRNRASKINLDFLDEDMGFWERQQVTSGVVPPSPTTPATRPPLGPPNGVSPPSGPSTPSGPSPPSEPTPPTPPNQPTPAPPSPYYSSNLAGPDVTCSSDLIDALVAAVPSVIFTTPTSCCGYNGPTAVYVTHSQPTTLPTEEAAFQTSGFEPFWNQIHDVISTFSDGNNICYVMTGYDPALVQGGSTLADVLIAQLNTVAASESTSVMMGTVPTESEELLDTIRSIWESPQRPYIGIFNSGFELLSAEAENEDETAVELLPPRIPYAGYLSDVEYGIIAADAAKNLLGDSAPEPLCLNHRPTLDFVGVRCSSYYEELGRSEITPQNGTLCTTATTEDEIYELIGSDTNSLFVQGDCLKAAADAVQRVKNEDNRQIFMGVADVTEQAQELLTLDLIDYIVSQPILGQAFVAASWASLPVFQDLNTGLAPPYNVKEGTTNFFPALGSVAHTAVFELNEI